MKATTKLQVENSAMVRKRELDSENDSRDADSANITESKLEEKQIEASQTVTKKAKVETKEVSKPARIDSTSTVSSATIDESKPESEKLEKQDDNGSEKRIQGAKAAPEAQVRHETLSTNALVIFGLHPLVTKEEMTKVMSKYGNVERIETRRAFASTYCFCDYETAKEAEEAIKNLNGSRLKGKELIVKLANDNASRSKPFSG